jgi:hypothetical protein
MPGRRPGATLVAHRTKGGAMNWGLIASFVIVTGLGLFVLYALIRPFTHKEHDHRDVFHPPHID